MLVVACGGGGSGGGSPPAPVVTITTAPTPVPSTNPTAYSLALDQISPLPLLNAGSPQVFYVYVTNRGNSSVTGITWAILSQPINLQAQQSSNKLTIFSAWKYAKSFLAEPSLKADAVAITILNQDACKTLGAGQTCKLELSASGAAVARIIANVDNVPINLAGGGGVIQTYDYAPTNPTNLALVLALSPITSINFANVPGLDFYIINNSLTDTVAITKTLSDLPNNVTVDFSACPDNLAPNSICPVRLSFTNTKSSLTENVPITLNGSINGQQLPAQNLSAVFSATNSHLGNIITVFDNNLVVNNSPGNMASSSGIGLIYNSGSADLKISQVTSADNIFVSINNDSCSGAVLPPNQYCTYTPVLNVNSITQNGEIPITITYNDGLSNSTALSLVKWTYIPSVPSNNIVIPLFSYVSGCSFGDGLLNTCYANPDNIGGAASSLKINFDFTLNNIPLNSGVVKIDLDPNAKNLLNQSGYNRSSSTCDSLTNNIANATCEIQYSVLDSVYDTKSPMNLNLLSQSFTYNAFNSNGALLYQRSVPLNIAVQIVLPTLMIESIGGTSLGGRKPVTLKWENLFLSSVTTTTGITSDNQAVNNITTTTPYCDTPSAGHSTCHAYIQSSADQSLLGSNYQFNAIGSESITAETQLASATETFSVQNPVIFMTRESYSGNLAQYDSARPQTGVGGADIICQQEAQKNSAVIDSKLSFKALLIDKDREPCSNFLDNSGSLTMSCGGAQASADWPIYESEVFYNPDGSVFNRVNLYDSFDGANANFEYADESPVDSQTTFWFGAPSILLGPPTNNLSICTAGSGDSNSPAPCPSDIVAWSHDFVNYLQSIVVENPAHTQQLINYGTYYLGYNDECSNYSSVNTNGSGVMVGLVGGVPYYNSNYASTTNDNWLQFVQEGNFWGSAGTGIDDSINAPALSNVWSDVNAGSSNLCSNKQHLVCVSQ